MSDEKSVTDNIAEDEYQFSKGVVKRAFYPVRGLRDIIEFVGKIYNQLGHTDYHSNLAIAALHGLSPESIKQPLSSAQQYKLLEIKYGTGYKISEHFHKIYLPRNDNEKRLSIIESLKHPEAYRQLFKDYEFHVVPPDGVKNHFIRSFGFKGEAAAKAAQVFLDNLKDFGLLDARGVLTSGLQTKSSPSDPVEVAVGETNNSNSHPENNDSQLPARQQRYDKLIFQSEIDAAGKKTIPVYLTDNKQAMFVYPDDINEDDIELVKHQIDGVLLRIKLESRKKAAGKDSV